MIVMSRRPRWRVDLGAGVIFTGARYLGGMEIK